MAMEYSEKVMEHFARPHNVGTFIRRPVCASLLLAVLMLVVESVQVDGAGDAPALVVVRHSGLDRLFGEDRAVDLHPRPHNVGTIEDANGVGEVGNAKCGDIMRMYLKINDEEIIEDVKFQTFGCASAIATSSIATDVWLDVTLRQFLNAVFDTQFGRSAHAVDDLYRGLCIFDLHSTSRLRLTPPRRAHARGRKRPRLSAGS